MMPGHDIIVIGASAGGVEAVIQLVRALPSDLDATLFIVLHIAPHGTSALPTILNRAGPLHAKHPTHGEAIKKGCIYIAPPNQHLLIKHGHIHLSRGPVENGHRPAVDPLFRTAARSFGPRVVGVILSGALDDGTAGLLAVKSRLGVAIVQDPDEALFDGMPRSAIENVEVDYVMPLVDIASLLVQLSRTPVKEIPREVSALMKQETEIVELDMDAVENEHRPGTPSEFACPLCGGALWEVQDGRLVRFRCRVGHAFSPETLLAEQSEAMEEALWAALRALEERAALSRRLADGAYNRSQERTAQRFEDQADQATRNANLIRETLLKGIGAGMVEYPDGRKEDREATD
jgi:two-component system, chemotaxis family, protein-glutamate methylesterase/glutaminase